jgi:hypothetical protein
MRVIKHSDPWDYFEVHGFFGNMEDFEIVDRFSKDIPSREPRTMTVIREGIVYDLLLDRMRKLCREIGFDLDLENTHEFTAQFDNIRPGWAYDKVHSDNPKKFVTFVLALSEQGTGTKLYTRDRSTYVKTTDWIRNGGNGFIRQDDTWHDFDSHGLTRMRRTAICMIAEQGWDSV